MTKTQYILLTAIVGFYGFLLMSLLARVFIGFWRMQRNPVKPQIEKLAHAGVFAKARNRAWTRAVWRGSLARDAQLGR